MVATSERQARLGIIDALSRGFELAGRVPWVVGLPVVLDLFLWRGPQGSLAPLADRALNAYTRLVTQRGLIDLGAPSPDTLEAVREALSRFNVFVSLALNLVAVPSSTQARPSMGPVVVSLEQPLGALVAFLALEAVGMALGCFYFGALGHAVRGGAVNLPGLLASVPRFWLRFALILLALIALPVTIGLPVGLLLAAVALASVEAAQAIGTLLLVLAQVGAVWLAIYLFFVIDAVAVGDLSARAAVRSSVTVVGRNLWPALGIIGLSFLISQGMFQVWHWMSQNDLGNVVAVVAHAYIASGLATASMVFYWDRVRYEQAA